MHLRRSRNPVYSMRYVWLSIVLLSMGAVWAVCQQDLVSRKEHIRARVVQHESNPNPRGILKKREERVALQGPGQKQVVASVPSEPSVSSPSRTLDANEGLSVSQAELTGEEIALRLDNSFDDESIDHVWSVAAMRDATKAILADLPDGSRLERVECKMNLCRVSTSHDDMSAYNLFIERAFVNSERHIWNGGISSLVREQRSQGLSAISYIAREGQGIPTHSDTY